MAPRKAAAEKKRTRRPTKTAAKTMSDEHKTALAAGREQSRAVRSYLDALDLHKPKRGRKRTSETVLRQLAEVESQLTTAVGAERLELLQRRRDLQTELDGLDQDGGVDLEVLKEGFVRFGRDYAERKGIDYRTFREFGVPPSVLKEAGIPRTRG